LTISHKTGDALNEGYEAEDPATELREFNTNLIKGVMTDKEAKRTINVLGVVANLEIDRTQ
jgi:hypothetical protein